MLRDEITQKQMRSKDKEDSLRTAQKANEAVGEDSPSDGFQEGFRVRMWCLEERSCWRVDRGASSPEGTALKGQERLQQSLVARTGAESLGWE